MNFSESAVDLHHRPRAGIDERQLSSRVGDWGGDPIRGDTSNRPLAAPAPT